jgi:hypothetical protein
LTGIALNTPTAFSLNLGQVFTMHGAPIGSDAPITIVWSSGTVGTATINASTGVLTLVAAGTTVITATVGAITATTTLTVVDLTLTAIALNTPAFGLTHPDTFQMAGTLIPTGASGPIVWSSSDGAKATIDAGTGLITTVGAGVTTITATVGAVSTAIVLTVS